MANQRVIYGPTVELVGDLTGLAPSQLSGFRYPSITNDVNGWQSFVIGVQLIGASEAKGHASIYLYESIDDGVTWQTGGNTGGPVTLTGAERLLGTVPILDGVVTMKVISLRGTSSRTPEFYPPQHWGPIITNESGVALPAGCKVFVTGIRTGDV